MGGSAATEVSEEAVKPAGSPFSSVAVMMATPAGWWPKASLNCSEVSGEGCLCCNGFGHDRPFLLRLRLGFVQMCMRWATLC